MASGVTVVCQLGVVLLVVVQHLWGKRVPRGPGRKQQDVVFIITLRQTQDLNGMRQ